MPNFIDNFGKDKKSERISKEAQIRRIERDMAGNPLLKNEKKISLPSPTEQDNENRKYTDYLGNPLPGYKWDKDKNNNAIIVEDKDYKEHRYIPIESTMKMGIYQDKLGRLYVPVNDKWTGDIIQLDDENKTKIRLLNTIKDE